MCITVFTQIDSNLPFFLFYFRYVKVYTCTNTAESNWFVSDSSKSFPSGHAALSMYTSIFVVVRVIVYDKYTHAEDSYILSSYVVI